MSYKQIVRAVIWSIITGLGLAFVLSIITIPVFLWSAERTGTKMDWEFVAAFEWVTFFVGFFAHFMAAIVWNLNERSVTD